MSIMDLEAILHPRSVAVVGASTNTASWGYSYIHHLIEYGFRGNIYPVHPNYTEVLGIKAYPSIRSIPDTVDFVISCVNAREVPQMVRECGEKGVKGIHLYTARFSETGHKDAADMEQEILRLARSKGIRIIGPNCMGVYHPKVGLSFGYNLPKEPGFLGMSSQTGGGASGFVLLAGLRGVRFSKVISYGNALDFNECDYLDYFVQDDETKVIVQYIEGVKDGRRYFETLKRATAVKPVIVIKGGRGKSGARMTSSHTASLAGSFSAWEAAIKQAGAVSARDFDELIDLAVSFYFLPPLRGNRVGVFAGGGGPSVIAAESCEEAGLEVIPLPQDMRDEMKARGVSIWDWVGNPVDSSIIGGSGMTDMDMMHLMAKHPDFDLLIATINDWVMMTLSTDERFRLSVPAGAQAYLSVKERYTKPFLVAVGERGVTAEQYDDFHWKALAEARSILLKGGLPIYPTIERAARAARKVIDYYKKL
ncbi:MAG: CoA-binding protein [Dehalococcoidia bacterium]|nr:CoA-binding protein [Dehalococcoidia bacterium]